MPRSFCRFILPALLFLAISPAPAQTKAPLIAVSDFEARGFSKDEALIISDQLRSELLNRGTFRVIERGQMETILKEQGFQQSGCTNDACAVEAGQLLGVKYIVVGSLGAAGSYTILTSRIIDVASGEILINRTLNNKGSVDVMIESGVAEMAKWLSNDFALKTGMKVDLMAQYTAQAEAKALLKSRIEQNHKDSLAQQELQKAAESARLEKIRADKFLLAQQEAARIEQVRKDKLALDLQEKARLEQIRIETQTQVRLAEVQEAERRMAAARALKQELASRKLKADSAQKEQENIERTEKLRIAEEVRLQEKVATDNSRKKRSGPIVGVVVGGTVLVGGTVAVIAILGGRKTDAPSDAGNGNSIVDFELPR